MRFFKTGRRTDDQKQGMGRGDLDPLTIETELPTRQVCARSDLEGAYLCARAAQHIAGLDRAHALRRAGVVHIARIERLEREANSIRRPMS